MSSRLIGIVVFAQMFDVGLWYCSGSGSCLLHDTGLVLRWLIAALGAVSRGASTRIASLPAPPEVAVELVILDVA